VDIRMLDVVARRGVEWVKNRTTQ